MKKPKIYGVSLKVQKELYGERTVKSDKRLDYREKNPLKHYAREVIAMLLRKKTITRKPCERCGENGQAHHEDYTKPLQVLWLCARHHQQRHSYLRRNDIHTIPGYDIDTTKDIGYRIQVKLLPLVIKQTDEEIKKQKSRQVVGNSTNKVLMGTVQRPEKKVQVTKDINSTNSSFNTRSKSKWLTYIQRLRPDQIKALKKAEEKDRLERALYVRMLIDENLPKRLKKLKLK